MPQMTPGQARVIDPVLSNAARGYQNADMVGMALFPAVPVAQRGGKIILFGKEAFRLYNTGRAPGANTARIQFGYDGNSFSLEQHALEATVPFENVQEAQAVPGIDLAAGAVALVQDVIALRLEVAQATLATTPGNYPASNKKALATEKKWNVAGGDPFGDIETGKEAIRQQIGKRPDTIVCPPAYFAVLKTAAAVVERIKYTGRDVATPELLASLFGVKRFLVGDAIYQAGNGTMVDAWGGGMVLAYTEVGGVAARGRPTYGYTYRLTGTPYVEPAYEDRPAKSWIYPVTDETQPVIVGPTAGYLITGAV